MFCVWCQPGLLGGKKLKGCGQNKHWVQVANKLCSYFLLLLLNFVLTFKKIKKYSATYPIHFQLLIKHSLGVSKKYLASPCLYTLSSMKVFPMCSMLQPKCWAQCLAYNHLVHWTIAVSTTTLNTFHHLPLTWLNPNIFKDLVQRFCSFRVFLCKFHHPLVPHSKPGAPPYNLRASGSYPDYRPYWTHYNIFISLHDWTNVDPVYILCYSHSIMGSKNFKSPRNKMTSQLIHLLYLINIYWVSSQALQLQ